MTAPGSARRSQEVDSSTPATGSEVLAAVAVDLELDELDPDLARPN